MRPSVNPETYNDNPGCGECNRDFTPGEQYVYHETLGSVGGPWCIKCATEHFGYTSRSSRFTIHYAEV